MKILMGGNPCTFWSIAQTKNRETEASGMGWELFKNYLIARDKYKPDFFLYENNKSMSAAIRAQITREFGFEPICINSALVSAQNRQRLYWIGRREPDGTYSRVDVAQPEDRGILLRDILETGVAFKEKAYTLKGSYGKTGPANFVDTNHFPAQGVAVPVNETADGKAGCLRATYYKDGIRNLVGNTIDRKTCVAEPVRVCNINGGGQGNRIYSTEAKSCAIKSNGGGLGGHGQGLYAIPAEEAFCVNPIQDGKSRTVDAHMGKLENNLVPRINDPNPAKQQYDCIAEPIRIGTIENEAKNADHDSKQYRVYSPDAKATTLCGCGGGLAQKPDFTPSQSIPKMPVREATKQGYTEIAPGECVDLAMLGSKTRRGRKMSDKSNCLTTSCAFCEYCGTMDKPVYKVENGKINIKGKEYPIKLKDGCYIIRKLTVTECRRLQTVPEWYAFPVSDSQAYKMLGNGWTVEVIKHLLGHIPGIAQEPVEVLSMYDGMSCGHIALNALGAQIMRYFASEIDKYAIQTTQHNFPETIQIGDAFAVREDGWNLEDFT